MSGEAQDEVADRSVGGGRYRLSRLLGKGGMASVHLGYDTVLKRPVAVKVLRGDLGHQQSLRERFRREALAVAGLSHTNIVSVFDSGEDVIEGLSVPFIVMEYVDGKPLWQELGEDRARYGHMPAAKALRITGEVLAALAESHRTGLVHRDIKPGNVMVTAKGVVKVMDFGIARALEQDAASLTQAGTVVGTPQYLSPEQAMGRGVDERSDLYSVGCMLFELLTGRLLFDGDSPLAMVYRHVQEEPSAPSSVNPSLPPAVDTLIGRALRKDPSDRFLTAAEMRQECERIATVVDSVAVPSATGAALPLDTGAALPPVTGAPLPPVTVRSPNAGTAPAPIGGPAAPAPPPNGRWAPQATPRPPGGSSAPRPPRRARGKKIPLIAFGSAGVVLVSAALLAAAHGTGGGASVKLGDPRLVVKPSNCTHATGHVSAGGEVTVRMPDLRFVSFDSARTCLDAAGWAFTVRHRDEQKWGKGTVVGQTPAPGSEAAPATNPITLYVSTGRRAG